MPTTTIPFADNAVSPVKGCTVLCELWPNKTQLAASLVTYATGHLDMEPGFAKQRVNELLSECANATQVYFQREAIAEALLQTAWAIPVADVDSYRKPVTRVIDQLFRCYAGRLHLRHQAQITADPEKQSSSGYAERFDIPAVIPGRLELEARRRGMINRSRAAKPWLNHQPRIILIGDMGEVFSPEIAFPIMIEQIIDAVRSAKGRRHLWLLPTRNVPRMAQFADHLRQQRIPWPPNLIPMAAISGPGEVNRIKTLQQLEVPARAIWAQPLRGRVDLDLRGIDWLIVGGESGSAASRFDCAWAKSLHQQCQQAGVAYFLSQLGSRPTRGKQPLELKSTDGGKPDPHGASMNEWPEWIPRVREVPASFRQLVMTGT